MEPEEKIEVVNAPQEIWLNFGDLSDVATGTVEYSELYASGEISWCYHEVDVSDVRYVRADCYDEREKEIQRLKGLLRDAADDLEQATDYGKSHYAAIHRYREAGEVTK